jgi:hypothetical protein
LGLTVLVLIVCKQVGAPDLAGETFAGIAGSVPTAIAISAQRRRARTLGPAALAAQVSPWPIVLLVATVSLVFDSIVGVISFGLAAQAPTEAAAGLILVAVGGAGLVIIAFAIGIISDRFGPRPYLWTSITVGIIFAVRVLVVLILLDAAFLLDAAVGHVFLLVFSLLATLAAVKLRGQRTGSAALPVGPAAFGPPVAATPVGGPVAPAPTVPFPAATPPGFPAPAPAPVAPAGWYPDPQLIGIVRYWDGSAWTDHRRNA